MGCVKDDLTSSADNRTREYIGFTAALTADTRSTQGSTMTSSYLSIDEQEWPLFAESDSEQTRGSVVSALNGLQVGMYAIPYKVENSNNEFQNAVMTNEQFLFINNEELEAAGEYVLWSSVDQNAQYLRVYGYAPYDSSISATTDKGRTTISYTVDSDITKQQDIIATEIKDVPTNYCQNIPLRFEHILTGVRFKAGFDCTVTSLKITDVKNSGNYTIGEVWKSQSGSEDFSLPIDTGKEVAAGEDISTEIFMMIPQALDGASVVMEYTENGTPGTITASLKGMRWDKGALVTYTIHKNRQQNYIYFDLAAGNIGIDRNNKYTGYVYVNGDKKTVTGTHSDNNVYYVYQSSTDERYPEYNISKTGYASTEDFNNKVNCRIPDYAPVTYNGQLWSDFITNNTSVEDVIEIWDDGKNVRGESATDEGHVGVAVVRDVGRTHTGNKITFTPGDNAGSINLIIDNIYSSYQDINSTDKFKRGRTTGGIAFRPNDNSNSTLTINIVGDNRVGCVHYHNKNKDGGNALVFEGTGSLTVADTDFSKHRNTSDSGSPTGYYSNRSNSAIGNSDDAEHAYNIIFNSGVIFAGTTKAEFCTAIGGGGNGHSSITINGGTITAVASATGTAIGGGTGLAAAGGEGYVTINKGNVYAYNFENYVGISTSAIGGAGSRDKKGSIGVVNIKGGYIYAYSELGTAIGGGSSSKQEGGDAEITITGGYVIAKSGSSSSIGGGNGGQNNATNGKPAYGGYAKVDISGNPTIRTGSIGGGKTNNSKGTIGRADIIVSGGDISAQFVMAGGAGEESSFTMTGGTISNSDVHSKEFYHTQSYGGAVYMEDGNFSMSENGTIRNCSADIGGAIYIKKSSNAVTNPKFEMKGGTITNCQSAGSGGAVYLEGGEVFMSGGKISQNMAKNGNGGGMYIAQGNLAMSGDANVTNNSAVKSTASASLRDSATAGNGGGIYVTSPNGNVNVDIIGGTITGNSCNQNGGGICVDMSQAKETDVATINIGSDGQTGGPQIDGNKAVFYGGGLYAKGTKAEVTIYGGSIKDNGVTNYVPNEDVANEGGTVELIDGDVSHKIVKFDLNTTDNSAAVNPGSTKIVTATNSYLNLPNATRNNYILEEWNTRSDGKGISYKTSDNPILMNITEDVTLYARWKSQATGQ